MPISTALFLACMAALRWLFLGVAGLFVLLALRGLVDPGLTLPWTTSLMAGAIFAVTSLAFNVLHKALERRLRRDSA